MSCQHKYNKYNTARPGVPASSTGRRLARGELVYRFSTTTFRWIHRFMLTILLRARGTGGRRGRGSRRCRRGGDGRGREQALQGWRHRVELVIEHLQPALGDAVHLLEAVAQPVFLPLRLRPQQRRRGVRDT